MKFAIVTPKAITETEALLKELSNRGHQAKLVAPNNFDSTDDLITTLSEFDVVYYRSGLSEQKILEVLGSVINTNTVVINPGIVAYPMYRSKLFQIELLKGTAIATPATLSADDSSTFESVQNTIGVPFVAKPVRGICGNGVELVKTESEFSNLPLTTKEYLFQEYLEHTADYRVFIIDGKVATLMKRTAPQDSFRTNISVGGTGHEVMNKETKDMLTPLAEKIAELFQFEIAGIDFIIDTIGAPYFIEINNNVGWKGLEQYTGINITSRIADWIESATSPIRTSV